MPFVRLDLTQEHDSETDHFRVTQIGGGNTLPADVEDLYRFVLISEAQRLAVVAAGKWTDGHPCKVYVREYPPAIVSEDDTRTRARFKYDGTIVEDLVVDEGDTPDVFTLEAVNAAGAVMTGVTTEYELQMSDGSTLLIDIVAGVATIPIVAPGESLITWTGKVEIVSTRGYRIEPDGRFTLNSRRTALRLG